MQQYVLNEELAYQDAPGGGGVGVTSAGPAIMQHGSAQQRQLYLPRIAAGEDRWCALYLRAGARDPTSPRSRRGPCATATST